MDVNEDDRGRQVAAGTQRNDASLACRGQRIVQSEGEREVPLGEGREPPVAHNPKLPASAARWEPRPHPRWGFVGPGRRPLDCILDTDGGNKSAED